VCSFCISWNTGKNQFGFNLAVISASPKIADCLKYRKKLGGNLAVKCCEKVSIDVNVANKDSGISQEYAAYDNWFTPHTLWSREHEL
jgi:hypothetical protein